MAHSGLLSAVEAVTLGDGTALAGWQRTINNVGNIKLLAVNGVFENDFQ